MTAENLAQPSSSAMTAPGTQHGQRRMMQTVGLVTLQIVMTIILITFLVPTLWMISSSLKASTEVFADPIVWIPETPQWNNYFKIFDILPFAQFAWNTLLLVVLAVGGTVISSAMVAYGFARIQWPGRNIFFALMIATMMLPEVITLIPRFIEFRNFDIVSKPLDKQLGLPKVITLSDLNPFDGGVKPDNDLNLFTISLRWLDSFLPLTVPYWFATTTLYVFLMYQFFRGIPHELEEAALIDGANRFQILTQILLPLSKPVLATVAVFALIQHYNEFLTPLIYLNKMDNWVLALGIRALNDSNVANWELVFAGSTVMLIPVLILFIIAQRYFVQGIALTGFGGR
jgi:ABC-type glycerol-3-phosphate transport system permease component